MRLIAHFLSIVFYGISQIMLQKNRLTGILFLIGISIGSWKMGIATLFATMIGTGVALLFQFGKDEIEDGIYGFSAALVGAALLFFFESSILIWVLVIAGAILASGLQHFFIRVKFPAFTLPFILVTWIALYFIPENLHGQIITQSFSLHPWIDFLFRNYGQVIFQDQVVIGGMFFVAVALANLRMALFGIIGGLLSSLIFLGFQFPFLDVSTGIFGFNAVLSAIALSGKKQSDYGFALLAVLMSVGLSWGFFQMNLPQLTFPFVGASAICSLLRQKWNKKQATKDVH